MNYGTRGVLSTRVCSLLTNGASGRRGRQGQPLAGKQKGCQRAYVEGKEDKGRKRRAKEQKKDAPTITLAARIFSSRAAGD